MHLNVEILDQIEELEIHIRDLLSEGKALESLNAIKELLALDSDDVNVCNHASGLLIDAGRALQDISLAEQGIGIIERVLEELPNASEHIKLHLLYNLSNGHSVKYEHFRDKDQIEERDESLQQQKHLLQAILLRRERIPAEIAPAVIANYANTLDHLNRTFEAVDQFLECLLLDPYHGLARGNCAAAIRRVVFFSEQHQLSNLQACWELSSAAVAKPGDIMKWADPEAVDHLVREHRRLQSEIEAGLEEGMSTLDSFTKRRQIDHPKEPGPEWVEQVRQDRLLLTFNLLPLDSAHETLEDAFFDSLIYGFSDQERRKSIELIHLFNATKEEFVTARHLYYLAENQEETLVARNDITLYGDPEGDAEFGLVSGLLKASFRSSIDLLDKIAVFLALYLDLGDPEDRVNFNNVWFEHRNPKKGDLHPQIRIALKDNYPLMGLRDLQRDFFRQEYPGPVKSARNATVHRWLRLSWLPIEMGNHDGTSWNLEDFSSLTLLMLRQAKAAILLLSSAVNVEERRRELTETDSQKILIPTTMVVRKSISARAADDLEDLRIELDLEDRNTGEQP